jgi:glycosyltransferase involved in cell wall biosynthesis
VVTRHGSASGAQAAIDGVSRRDPDWTDGLARRHEAYRGSVEPLRDAVAVVCVSNRPHRLAGVIDAVARSTHTPRELVFVTNSHEYRDVDVVAAARGLESRECAVTVLRRPPEQTLGACLNDALRATDARFVAKYDDDDLYGPDYLSDALRAHAYSGAGVVGKHTYYAYLAEYDRTVLRFPAHEFTYSSTLAGGTLVIDRERTGDIEFPDISLGEDRGFLARCHRRGVSTFSADRFNFVQVRASDNTWRVGHDDFLARTVPVGEGLALDAVNI